MPLIQVPLRPEIAKRQQHIHCRHNEREKNKRDSASSDAEQTGEEGDTHREEFDNRKDKDETFLHRMVIPKTGPSEQLAASITLQGAVWGGAKAFTVTSGPGFSLMMEHIGYAAMTETPCVFVDVQRGGPSTGLPTLPAQADMMLDPEAVRKAVADSVPPSFLELNVKAFEKGFECGVAALTTSPKTAEAELEYARE
jgi:hypothetical protein